MAKYRVCVEKGCRAKAMDSPIPSPKEYVEGRSLTLFGWTLILYKEKTEHACDLCEDHFRDERDRPYQEAYDAGFNAAADKFDPEGF